MVVLGSYLCQADFMKHDNNCIDTADIILIERDSFNLSSSVIDDSCSNSCT